MIIIQISSLPNGAYQNQTWESFPLPEGYAAFPEEVTYQDLPNFPFGEAEIKNIDGNLIVTHWKPGILPESKTEPESNVNFVIDLLADQEERLCLMEIFKEGT